MRGQSSIEFLLVLVAFLAVLSSFTVPKMYESSFSTANNVNSVVRARNTCDKVSSAVNRVAPSENAVDSMWVSFSSKWKLHMGDDHRLKVGVKTSNGWENVESRVIFAPDGDKKWSFDSGKYLLIVERTKIGYTDNAVYLDASDDRMYLKLDPTEGGTWKN